MPRTRAQGPIETPVVMRLGKTKLRMVSRPLSGTPSSSRANTPIRHTPTSSVMRTQASIGKSSRHSPTQTGSKRQHPRGTLDTSTPCTPIRRTSQHVVQRTPQRGSHQTPRRTPQRTPKRTSQETPQRTPQQTPQHTPQRTPQRTPQQTPQRGHVLGSRGEPLESEDTMKVFLRVRPLLSDDTPGEQYIEMEDSKTVRVKAPKTSAAYRTVGDTEGVFSFSQVFSDQTTQSELFESSVRPVIRSFLQDRENGVIFAYGMTRSGKTYTIRGGNDEESYGVLPRTLRLLFRKIDQLKSARDGGEMESIPELDDIQVDPSMNPSVIISYCELYNEQIFDLLVDTKRREARQPLKFKETKHGKVWVHGLREQLVTSEEDAMSLLQRGSRNRQIAETMLNQSSSRSHCIFSIKFVQVPRGVDKAALQQNPSLIKYCRLSLIDLAGSERASRTRSTGARLREAGAINKSLMTFGRCIKALRFNQLHPTRNPQVIPYRESKLTRLLQDLFSGNARAVMFVNLCPDPADFDESVHVLKFSAIATQITTVTRVDTGLRTNQRSRRVDWTPSSASADVDILVYRDALRQVSELKQELLRTEKRCARVETEIRDEVSSELAERLTEIEMLYQERLNDELEMMEEKYERKLAIVTRLNTASTTKRSLTADKEQIRALAQSLEQASNEVVYLRSQVQDTQETDVLRAELRECEHQRDEFEQQVVSLRESFSKIAALKKATIEAMKKEHNEEMEEQRAAVELLGIEMAQSQEEQQRLSKLCAQLQARIDELLFVQPSSPARSSDKAGAHQKQKKNQGGLLDFMRKKKRRGEEDEENEQDAGNKMPRRRARGGNPHNVIYATDLQKKLGVASPVSPGVSQLDHLRHCSPLVTTLSPASQRFDYFAGDKQHVQSNAEVVLPPPGLLSPSQTPATPPQVPIHPNVYTTRATPIAKRLRGRR
mmetsp:Transcript_8586/g.26635  ORF Transcript_8586/g.26635 Transcript_8586/m.26635 type:complete len:944 (-) Transcript_8586:5405-8236(-)|eukprot:CAMPEP_0177643520 /NCGR_PEP_ID=MMETSP0447-20121125/8196_1 /TAXON_ID=0 /ORGANISM="Stygamoeba regulata, Strain BSH-02190019" /LENGTH=943 /DNA_ID=CAMNT_0019145815 /DNA_START=76 /DNA_END=2907 /DNA_ORIENTATION=+